MIRIKYNGKVISLIGYTTRELIKLFGKNYTKYRTTEPVDLVLVNIWKLTY